MVKKYKLVLVMSIISFVLSAGFALITLGYSIADGDIFVIALMYFCLYTAGAAVVLIKNKKDRNL